MDSIDIKIGNLPVLLASTIRRRTWQSPSSADLRQLARIVGGAQDAGLPDTDLLVLLATYARADLPIPSTHWSTEMRVIEGLLWPFLASATALSSRILHGMRSGSTVADAIEVARRHVAEETAKRAMDPADADRAVRAEMERVSALYPELGMSYGYIGNIWWGPRRDDRSFMVFTTMRDEFGYSVSFGGHGHDQLSELAFMAKARLEDWAAKQAERLRAGEIRDVRAMAA